jgi:hypothetical protein
MLLIKSGLRSSLDKLNGVGLGFGLFRCSWLGLRLGRESSKFSLGLCVNSGCVSTLDRVVVCKHLIHSPFNELIVGLGI